MDLSAEQVRQIAVAAQGFGVARAQRRNLGHLLDRLTYREGGAYEYWGHAASIIDMSLYPALRWRMVRQKTHQQWARWLARVETERPGYAHDVYADPRATRDTPLPRRCGTAARTARRCSSTCMQG